MANNMNTNALINVAVRGVEQLNQLQSKVQQTNKAFGDLKSAIAGVVTAGFLGGLYKMANDLTDMAAATGLSTEAILGFTKAVSANGGSVEGATAGVGKFVQAIESAANGSKEAQDSLLALGITLTDLRNLSEEELLKKAIKGFDNATTASERLSLAVQLFGKTARSWDMGQINKQLDEYITKSKESAAAVAIAGETSQNFSNAYKELGIQILVALKPISELANAILSSGTAMKEFIRLAIEIGTVVLTFTALGKIWKWGAVALTAFAEAGAAIAATIGGATSAVSGFGAALMLLLRRFPAIAAIAVGVSLAFGQVRTALEEMGVVQKKDTKDKEENTDAAGKQAGALREVTDAYKKQKDAIKEIVDNFDKQNKKTSEQLQLETSLLGKSKEQQDVAKAQFEIAQRYQETLDKLTEARGNLTKEELRAGVGTKYDEEIARLTKLAEVAKARAKADAEANNIAINAEELRKFAQQNELDNAKQLQTIRDNIAKSTMSEAERRQFDITAQAKARGNEKADQEEIRRGIKLTTQERQAYIDTALAGSEQLSQASQQEYENSRKFSTGWAQAFNEYADNATNAAEQAKRVFQSMTTAMEDLLYNFFKTGKFGWKNFVQTIVDTLLRSQIQSLVAKIMAPTMAIGGGGGGGSGGLFGGSIIPGILAGGGPAAMNRPYIVGERGPELFVPASNGSVIPNSGLGSGQNVTYNINAVDAMSFKSMLARDPAFLYSVTQLGAKSIPGRA